MTPRTASFGDGAQGSLLLDFITDRLKSPYALFEHSRLCGYTRQPLSRKVFHLPFKARIRRAVSAPGGAFDLAAPERKAEAEFLSSVLEKAYGFEFESGRIWWMIDDVLCFRAIYSDLFKRWLDRLGVRVLVTAVPEVKENALLAEAAHSLGIPVVELQHGTIHRNHMVYRLGEKCSPYSPDYLLTWGEHWSEQTLNYPAIEAVATGYPFLDHFACKCPRRPRGSAEALRVLFLSQGGIGADLSRAAVRLLGSLPPGTCSITYKLHPNETRTWRDIYPWLVDSGVKVVGNDEKNIFECLQCADVTVGSSSSSLVEGFAWGIRALVLKWLPGYEIMTDFRESGAAELIESENALYDRIRTLADESGEQKFVFRKSDFWTPDAAENIASFLEYIIS